MICSSLEQSSRKEDIHMDKLKRLLGNCAGKSPLIEKIRIASTQKIQTKIDEKAAEIFVVLIDRWSCLRTNSPEEKKCVQEIINLCFEPPIKGGKTRRVKDVCIIDTDYSIFWKIISVYTLIPKKYELRSILKEVLSASQITSKDWEKAQNEAEGIFLTLQK